MPVTISNPGNLNLSAYAVLGDDQNFYCTIINKEHSLGASATTISVSQDGGHFSQAKIIFLTAPQNDIAATSDETLGGDAIQKDGTWSGAWQPLASLASDKEVRFEMPPASAAIVKLSTR
jgi:hypothetical protein